MNNFIIGLLSSATFLLALLLLEYVTRQNGFRKELTRRIAHILSGLFGVAMGLVLEQWVFITFLCIFLLIISLSYGAKFFTSIHGVKRKTYGEIFLPLGILLAYLLANSTIHFVAVILILTISDPLAGIIGDVSDKKLTHGSMFFFASTLAILLITFQREEFVHLTIVAFILTIIEGASSYGTDNLTIPLVGIILLNLMF